MSKVTPESLWLRAWLVAGLAALAAVAWFAAMLVWAMAS